MEAVVMVRDVKELRSRSGNVRYVLVDDQGREYTTFREEIGRRAAEARGRRARIEFHESERNGYTNVYLDAVEVVDEPAADGSPDDDEERIEEAAWRTTLEAAPWLVGSEAPDKRVEADELFERLKPFKELVAEDIRDGAGEEPEAEP